MDCLFCKISRGEIPSEKVYEDDDVFAFLDIRPVNPGHALIVPKAHFVNIFDIPPETFANVMVAAKKLAPYIKDETQAHGINIGMNNEAAAGQAVFHAHVHVIPRFENDGHEHWHGAPYDQEESRRLAARLRERIEKTD